VAGDDGGVENDGIACTGWHNCRMSPEWVKNFAFARMPKIDAQVVSGTHRHDVIRTLTGANNIGIELGVAPGVFAERMLRSGKFARYFGVDRYSDLHDTQEYKAALKRIGLSVPSFGHHWLSL
jgi:hypothetical protein